MTRRHLIRRTFIATMAAGTLAASGASAMPVRDPGRPAARHHTKTHPRALQPDRVDAAAHARTIRGIAARIAG